MKKETQSLKNANRKSVEFSYTALLIFGTFGAHQFYLSNKMKGLYLLATTGISQFLLFTSMKQIMFYGPRELNGKIILAIVIAGAVLGFPVWVWDLFTLHKQVKKFNSENGFESQKKILSTAEIILLIAVVAMIVFKYYSPKIYSPQGVDRRGETDLYFYPANMFKNE